MAPPRPIFWAHWVVRCRDVGDADVADFARSGNSNVACANGSSPVLRCRSYSTSRRVAAYPRICESYIRRKWRTPDRSRRRRETCGYSKPNLLRWEKLRPKMRLKNFEIRPKCGGSPPHWRRTPNGCVGQRHRGPRKRKTRSAARSPHLKETPGAVFAYTFFQPREVLFA